MLVGILEPCYDNGGDALDYAINDGVLHVGIFDAMGHGLAAAGVAAFALSAYRHSRRRGCGLLETYASMDHAVRDQFPGDRYVTAVIAQLHLETGRLTWVSAGHPPPLVIRHARLARTLSAPPAAPLGIPLEGPAAELAEESFEPGDLLLLYTDGLTEARQRNARCSRSPVSASSSSARRPPGRPLPRRCAGCGRPSSSASRDSSRTMPVLVEWRRGGETDLLPPTAR